MCLNLVSASAQMGGPKGPQLSGNIAKLFGKNSAFSAAMEMQTLMPPQNQTVTMPGKIAFDAGKSRFEMDMSEMKGASMPPQAIAQMKTMGMDKMVMIARPDKKLTYMVYPNLQAYTEIAITDQDAVKAESDFNVEVTKLGEEKVDGHPCIKNKAVVSDKQGNKYESTVWNATDLKDFPVKIEVQDQGHAMTMLFKDVKLAKPEASLFESPAGLKRYDNPMALIQGEMMKRMGAGMGMPQGK